MSIHPQVRLCDPFTGHKVGIDRELVPVIKALWAAGIKTNGSCQGPPLYDGAIICFTEPIGFDESPGYWDPPDDGPDVDRWCAQAEAFEAARPSGAEQLWRMLPPDIIRATWHFTFRDDLNPGSALSLPASDIPVLAQALEAQRMMSIGA